MKDRFERQIRDIKSERDSYKKERSHIVSQFDLCVSNYDKIKSQITDITQRSDKCTDEKWHLQQRVNTQGSKTDVRKQCDYMMNGLMAERDSCMVKVKSTEN